MPVTVYPAPHPSEPCALGNLLRNASPEEVLRKCSALKHKEGQVNPTNKLGKIWDSSFSKEEHVDVYPSANGFVHGAIRAYNAHHHLRIRPDDVWIAILSQLSIYINKNAEALRSIFVSHQGRKPLNINGAMLDGFDQFAAKITEVLGTSIKDPSVATWVMQDFSTTTTTDRIAAGIIMMATFQSYFKYYDCCTCGLPYVTLLGTREDWLKLRKAVDRLTSFVPEKNQTQNSDLGPNSSPAMQMRTWASMLKPVLDRFVTCFDEPDSNEILTSWQQIADYRVGGSGADHLSGWVTAFCFWNEMGECTHPLGSEAYTPLKYDGVGYHIVEWDNVPPGCATVPLEIDLDDGMVHKCQMLAGSVGITPFLAKIQGPETSGSSAAKASKLRRSKNASSSEKKSKTLGDISSVLESDRTNPATSSASKRRGRVGNILQKLLSCCDPRPDSDPGVLKLVNKQGDLPADSLPPVPGQEIIPPPYRPRPAKEPSSGFVDKDPVPCFENSLGWRNDQTIENPPPYRLDGLQPRVGW